MKYITAAELRQTAFDSHPVAYTEGGLILVVMLSPKLIFHVAAIPSAEFNPAARTFIPTVVQTILVPDGVAYMLQFSAGPGHTSVLRGAMQADANRLADDIRLGSALVQAKQALDAGRLDHVDLLDHLRNTLIRREWPQSDHGRLAEDLAQAIVRRRTFVLQRYRRETIADKQLLDVFRLFDRKAF